jgi:hypothetical protein
LRTWGPWEVRIFMDWFIRVVVPHNSSAKCK